jgi:hypothetical protein
VTRFWPSKLVAGGLLPLVLALTALSSGALSPTALPAPPGHSDPESAIASISCPSAGNCTAVGANDDSQGAREGMLLTETGGTWSAATEAVPPPGAGTEAYVTLSSVSCASPGNCGAVGDYLDSAGHLQGILLDQVAGTWSSGVEVQPPTGAGSDPYVEMASVSCPAPGNCSAAGTYTSSSDEQQGLLVNETSGTWGGAMTVLLPPGASGRSSLSSVSCPAPGNCTTVGFYAALSGGLQGLIVTESSGTWASGAEAGLPAGAVAASLASVSCSSPGNCSAVGDYTGDNGGELNALVVDEASSTWGAGLAVALPPRSTRSELVSVSCSEDACAAGGSYSGSDGGQEGLLVSESAGTWGKGVTAPLPASAPFASTSLALTGISEVACPTTGECSAVGFYTTDCNCHGMVLHQSSIGWAATAVPVPGGTSPGQQPLQSFLTSLACPAPRECEAVGSYVASDGDDRALIASDVGGTVSDDLQVGPSGGAPWYFNSNAIWCGASTAHCVLVGDVQAPISPGDQLITTSPMVLVLVGGTWRWYQPAPASRLASALHLASLSCTSTTDCTAVGSYTDASGEQGLVVTEASGVWRPASRALPPAGASGTSLASVSCPSVGNCTAVGSYTGTRAVQTGVVVIESAGRWARGRPAAEPARASRTSLSSVSCASVGSCTAVGHYQDASGAQQGLVLTKLTGNWSASPAPLPPGANTIPWAELSSVSCERGNCVMAGVFLTISDLDSGLLLRTPSK